MISAKMMTRDAIKTWRAINATPDRWASFEAVTFPEFKMCHVRHGVIHSNGIKERPIESIVWTLYNSGRYDAAVRLAFT